MSRFPGDTSSQHQSSLSPSNVRSPSSYTRTHTQRRKRREKVVEEGGPSSNRFKQDRTIGGTIVVAHGTGQGKYVNLAKFSFTQPPVYQKFNWIFGRGLGPGRLGSWPASFLPPPRVSFHLRAWPWSSWYSRPLYPSLREYYSSCPFHLWFSSDFEIVGSKV